MTKYKGFTISKVAKRDRMYEKGYKYRATSGAAKAFGGSKIYGRTMVEIKGLVSKSYTCIEKQKKKIEKLRLEIKQKRESIK